MIKPKCNMCEKELEEFGGVILSPPSGLPSGQVVNKFHICVSCYNDFLEPFLIIETEAPDIDLDKF